jgi:probable HAF family extracellular repeat protein
MFQRVRYVTVITVVLVAIAQGLGPGTSTTLAAGKNSSPHYSYTDLGLPPGATSVYGLGINASGEIVGGAQYSSASQHAILWKPGSGKGKSATPATFTDLGTLAGSNSRAASINDAGTIVGTSDTSRANTYGIDQDGFVWTPTSPNGASGTMADIGTFGGHFSDGYGINNAGQFVGDSQDANGTGGFGFMQSFLYPATSSCASPVTGTNTDSSLTQQFCNLSSGLPSGYNSGALAINNEVRGNPDSTEIAGQMNTQTGEVAFLCGTASCNAGNPESLGTLGGTYSAAVAINDSGQVAGSATTTNDANQHPFLWQPTTSRGTAGTMSDLGVLSGDTDCWTYAISPSGQVVGYCYNSSVTTDTNSAFLWTPAKAHSATGTMTDLNADTSVPTGVKLEFATAINASGWIVAIANVGTDSSGNPISHIVLLKPA